MDPNRFDTIARTLGTQRSRRGVMKTLGASALGALGLAGINRVVAAPGSPGGNSACAHFCAATFGADTPAADQCTSDAAHSGGLCYSCAGPEGTPCSSNQVCQGGTCLDTCANAVLSSTADGTGQIGVDDTLTVSINGTQVFQSGPAASTFDPVSLGSVTQGDQIEAVANNSPYYCGYISLSALYLFCPSTNTSQTLDATGVPGGGMADCGVTFYDQTFTADF